MAAKNLWESMTGWISKPAGSMSSEPSSGSSGPPRAQPAPPAASPSEGAGPTDFGKPEPANLAPTAVIPAVSSAGASATQSGEGAPLPAGADPSKPDEGPEINRKIIEVIKTCYDPEIPVNIFELGLIYYIKVDAENKAHVKMTLTAPNCPAAQSLPAEVKSKIEAMDEIQEASVEIVFDPPWTPNKMSDSAKLVLNML
jgi:FeS assembly SUF system protein